MSLGWARFSDGGFAHSLELHTPVMGSFPVLKESELVTFGVRGREEALEILLRLAIWFWYGTTSVCDPRCGAATE